MTHPWLRPLPTRRGTGPLFAGHSSRDVLGHVEAALDPRSLLTPAELARSAALARKLDQEGFVAARVLVRLLLRKSLRPGADLGSLADFVLTQQCSHCGGPHGRPVSDVPGTAVSWAHAGGFVAAAVGPGSVGVDVEPMEATTGHVPASGTARSWVRSEAIIKWGHGDLDDALAWQSRLQGPASRRGRHHVLSRDAAPRHRVLTLPGAGHRVVVTDSPRDSALLCSVAASTRARWVDALRP